MRYIDTGREYIPKHCIYGPRQAEGLVLKNYEWWSITDHLSKEQREREMAMVLKAKEEAKKNLSYEMTSTWSNTLASIKNQSKQKRLDKLEKEKQGRIDAYHEILKNHQEEKRKLLERLRKEVFMEQDGARTIKSAVWYATALDDIIKEIEKKKQAGEAKAKQDREWVLKFKKDLEELHMEECQEKLNEKAKKKIYRQELEAQMAEKAKKKLAEAEELEREKQDLINMKIELEKIHRCEMKEKEAQKAIAAKYKIKPESQIERNLVLEDEEENEIIKIYWDYECRIKKKRKEIEEIMKREAAERRAKVGEIIFKKMQEKQQKEENFLLAGEIEKEEQAKREEEEKKEKERLAVESILEGRRQALEWRAKKEHEAKERTKWEMMQAYRSKEVNDAWIAENKRQTREKHLKLVKVLECQMKQNEEKRAEERKEMMESLKEDPMDKEHMLSYCQEAMNFIKEYNLPERPVRVAITKMKKLYGIVDEEEQKLEEGRRLKEAEQQNKRQMRLGTGCYCFKY